MSNGQGISPSNTTGAAITFVKAVEGDCISDETMEELVRRLKVDLAIGASLGIHRGTSPPTDKSKLWQPVDSNGIPVGGIKTYNPRTGNWEAGT